MISNAAASYLITSVSSLYVKQISCRISLCCYWPHLVPEQVELLKTHLQTFKTSFYLVTSQTYPPFIPVWPDSRGSDGAFIKTVYNHSRPVTTAPWDSEPVIVSEAVNQQARADYNALKLAQVVNRHHHLTSRKSTWLNCRRRLLTDRGDGWASIMGDLFRLSNCNRDNKIWFSGRKTSERRGRVCLVCLDWTKRAEPSPSHTW